MIVHILIKPSISLCSCCGSDYYAHHAHLKLFRALMYTAVSFPQFSLDNTTAINNLNFRNEVILEMEALNLFNSF